MDAVTFVSVPLTPIDVVDYPALNYTISTGTSVISRSRSYPITNPFITLSSKTFNLGLYNNTDLVRVTDPQSNSSIALDNDNITIPISATCSLSNWTQFSQQINFVSPSTQPSWFTYDLDLMEFYVDTTDPSIVGGTTYQFSITSQTGQFSDSQDFFISFAACVVSECMV
jgi:hypothetical protein